MFATSCLAQDAGSTAPKSEPIPQSRQQPRAAQSQQATTEKQSEAAPIAAFIERLERTLREIVPKPDQEQDKRKEDREIRDLNAQTEMALWAERMFWATVASVVVTFIGVLLILWTLHYTRVAAEAAEDAVTEAEKATAAAFDTIRATREIGEAQIRPYVGQGRIRWISHWGGDQQTDLFWRIHWGLNNTGATPTRKLRMRSIADVVNAGVNFNGFRKNITPFPAHIHAGGEVGLGHIDVPADVLAEVARGEKNILIFMEATYGNSINADSHHITRIGLRSGQVTGDPTRYWDEKENPVNIVFHHVGTFNCTDKDCDEA